jgi:hypothetical protein
LMENPSFQLLIKGLGAMMSDVHIAIATTGMIRYVPFIYYNFPGVKQLIPSRYK